MIQRLVRAAIVGVAIYLLCFLVSTDVAAAFLSRFAIVLGALAAVYHFLGGRVPLL